MTNELTKPEDDGFSGSLSNSKRRGTFVNWADATGWRDRDGLEPPSPVLVVAIDEALQRWANKVPTLITDKPLPDPASLNEQIPAREWEIGLDGQPVPPWKHVVIVLLVNIATGGIYKYVAPTAGAHIAVDLLKESVITMRALRGSRVLPVVNLTKGPMKTKFGPKMRPHFEIVGWKTPGEDGNAIPAKPTPPELTGPATAPPASSSAASPPTSPPTQPRPPKRPVKLSEYTLATMGDVKPVTTEEFLNDSLDDLPWDK